MKQKIRKKTVHRMEKGLRGAQGPQGYMEEEDEHYELNILLRRERLQREVSVDVVVTSTGEEENQTQETWTFYWRKGRVQGLARTLLSGPTIWYDHVKKRKGTLSFFRPLDIGHKERLNLRVFDHIGSALRGDITKNSEAFNYDLDQWKYSSVGTFRIQLTE